MIESIKAKEYGWTCGDGCCYEWGVMVYIEDDDGSVETYDVTDVDDAILSHLNLEVEWLEADDESNL